MHIMGIVSKIALHIQLKIRLIIIVPIFHKNNQKYIRTHKPKTIMEHI